MRKLRFKLSKRIRKVFSALLSILLFMMSPIFTEIYADSISSSSIAGSYSVDDLLNMEDADCLNFLLNMGLQLPTVYKEDPSYTAEVIKIVLEDIKNGSVDSETIPYNYTQLVELAKNIYSLVGSSASSGASIQATYTLIDSTVLGSWSSSYKNYNCYGYALRQYTKYKDPGYYCGKTFDPTKSIDVLAELVRSDLNSLGYYSRKTKTKPTSLQSYESVICVRKETADYHFMREGSSLSVWDHKPSATNPLRWKYSTPNYKKWSNEHVVEGVAHKATTYYDSDIYYIIFYSKSGSGPSPESVSSELK